MVVSYHPVPGRATFWPQVSTACANHVCGFLLVQHPHYGVFKSMDHETLQQKGKRDRLLVQMLHRPEMSADCDSGLRDPLGAIVLLLLLCVL